MTMQLVLDFHTDKESNFRITLTVPLSGNL